MSATLEAIDENHENIQRMAEKEKKVNQTMTLSDNIDSEKNLMDILARHRTDTLRKNSLNQQKHHKAELQFGRDNFQRTSSMLSYLSGVEEDEIMTRKYKYVTTAVLWFCYFSLVCNPSLI